MGRRRLISWMNLVFGIFALALAGLFLVQGLGSGFTTGLISRIVIFTVAGLLWGLEFRKGA